MWSLILMVAPQLLKLIVWDVDRRNQIETNFRAWAKDQQTKAPLYVEVKKSYDDQVAELNKEELPNVEKDSRVVSKDLR